jgi:hypothetical protein
LITWPSRRSLRTALFAAASLCLASLLGPAAGHAAEGDEPTTYRHCYKSVRACQKSRCGTIDDEDQVTCMRQCNREYETCVSGAGAGTDGGTGSIFDIPDKILTPNKPRDMRRNKLQGDQD